MRFSVFTPSHNIQHLNACYESLMAQTCHDWEWIVGLNNGATCTISEPAGRVAMLTVPPMIRGVGALKAWLCNACEGEYLVELDHDDMLSPMALQILSDAIDTAHADFLYSDCVEFRADGTSHVYGKHFGWEHEIMLLQTPVAGPIRSYTINKSFPLTASSMAQIFYAPNHVRVWRRATYELIGGHDPRLEVCDDFDLVCRTYLHGAKFHYLETPLYFYRMHEDGNQTYLKHNAEIQIKQAELGDRYRRALIQSWCERASLPMWDLGGGENSPKGFKTVDLVKGTDVWEFLAGQADDSVGCFRAHDFLEHIPHCRDSKCTHMFTNCVVELMNQIYRALVPGGWLITATPSTDGRGAFQDPTHCSFWNENSWLYYTRAEQQRFVPGIRAKFQATRIYTDYPNQWCRERKIPYVFADVVALKGQRQPGLCEV